MINYSEWFNIGPLGCGRTTAIALACKSINAIMLCADSKHAKQVEHEHGIRAISIQGVGHGHRGPFLADHYAIQSITHKYEFKIREQARENNKLLQRITVQSNLIDRYRTERDRYKREYFKLRGDQDG